MWAQTEESQDPAAQTAPHKPSGWVLVAVQDARARADATAALNSRGFSVVTADDLSAANRYLDGSRALDAVLLDLAMAPGGKDALRNAISSASSRAPVWALTDASTAQLVETALDAGAADVVPLATPWEVTAARLGRACTIPPPLQDALTPDFDSSEATERALEEISRAAPVEVPVLLRSSPGLPALDYALALHRRSARSRRPFVHFDCRRVADPLEAYLERAHGGTIFLDHIDAMDKRTQARLSRVLDERELDTAHGPVRIDLRLVCSSCVDLSTAASENNFRPDLLYRVAGFSVRLPALKERTTAIDDATARMEAPVTQAALDALRTYPWPGNDRELDLVLERAALVAWPGQVDAEHLPLEIAGKDGGGGSGAFEFPLLSLEEYEDRALRVALQHCGGNVTRAARQLGIGRATFYRKARKFGLEL